MDTFGIIGLALLGIGFAVAGIAGILLCISAFRTSLPWGFSVLLIPFAFLAFAFQHWEAARKPFKWWGGGFAASITGFILLFFAIPEDSPETTYEMYQEAVQAKDLPGVFVNLTVESQETLVAGQLMAGAMMRMSAGPKASTDPKFKKFEGLMMQMGGDLSTTSTDDDLSASFGRAELLQKMMDVLENEDDFWKELQDETASEIEDVSGDANTATGKAGDTTYHFKRVDERWLIDLLQGTLDAMEGMDISLDLSALTNQFNQQPPAPRQPQVRDKTVRELRALVEKSPDDPAPLYELAVKRLAFGKYSEATDHLRRAFELNARQLAQDPSKTNLVSLARKDPRLSCMRRSNSAAPGIRKVRRLVEV